jgi:hypothetical protein
VTHDQREELYVGYLDKTPLGVARFTRSAVIGLVLLAAVLGAGLALLLERFDESVFEYGTVGDYEGELLIDPHPRLLTADGPAGGYLLVGVGKQGLDVNGEPSAPRTPSPSRKTELSGTLIRNPEAAMLEVHSLELPEGAPEAGPAVEPDGPAEPAILGQPLDGESVGPAPDAATNVIRLHGHTLLGEIVDTKCYLGAMKPGRGKPHRDCASLCIRGGIPAALLVRTTNGERHLVHLLSVQGQPLGQEVLELVGEPVEVLGSLSRRDDRLLLRTFVIKPKRAPARSIIFPRTSEPGTESSA